VKKITFILLYLFSGITFSAVQYQVYIADLSEGTPWLVTVPDLNCATVLTAFTETCPFSACSAQRCSSDLVSGGTVIYFRANGLSVDLSLNIYTVTAICPAGFKFDSATNNCIRDPSQDNTDSDLQALQIALSRLQLAQAENSTLLQKLLTAQAEPFDISVAWAAFTFFFSGVIVLWAVAKGGGAILSAIRKG
jgi:hypothetical protein